MNASTPFIVCDNLVKIYKVDNLEVVALQGLDLTVVRGEIIGVIGPSGSGKSSLMNILGGLDRPSAGKVRVGVRDLLKSSNADLNLYRRTQVGFIWQQSARNLVPYLNALDNVILPMTLASIPERQKRAWGNELLDMVGMSVRKRHLLSEMSGGELQRVAIAVSLANRPGLLLADEPTGEVDEETASQVYDTFQQLNQQLGTTILIVSHDPDIAQHVNRVVVIRDGKLATETVRRVGAKNITGGAPAAEMETQPEYEELSVLDSAGRVQLPKDYLDRLAIKNRVRLELLEGGIMIRPANTLEEQPILEHIGSVSQAGDPNPTNEGGRFLNNLFRKLRTLGKNREEKA